MDNADLERLSVSPGKLSPAFHKDTVEYNAILGSEVTQLKLTMLTSDSGASYTIRGGDGGKTIDLKEGAVTCISIEVTSEDGSNNKTYTIKAKRLSASDASLSSLKLSSGHLSPTFSPEVLVTNYTVTIPSFVTELKLDASVADTKSTVILENGDISTFQQLNFGDTCFLLKVTSPDGSSQQQYKVCAMREHVGRSTQPVDRKSAFTMECPICLNLVYRPRAIANSKHCCVFCAPCIAVVTRTNKIDPVDETPLEGDWLVEKPDVEVKVSELDVHSLTGEKVQLKQLAKVDKEWKDKNGEPKVGNCQSTTKLSLAKADGCSPDGPEVKHTVSARPWEIKLQQEGEEFEPSKADHWLKKYKDSLPTLGSAVQYTAGESPIDYLYCSAVCYANAIKQRPRDAASHLKLACVLEEIYYAQDLYGVKKSEQDDSEDTGPAAVESSKAEEFLAICQLRGIGSNAPLAKQLKAVEEEFQQLKEQGQTAKAEHVQSLYQWKSKQVHRGSKLGPSSSDEETVLGKAYLKYMDALQLESGGHKYNLQAGRMLLLQGKVKEALDRLKVAMAIKPNTVETRLYYGLVLCQQSQTAKEGSHWLNDALSYYLHLRSTSSCRQAKGCDNQVLLAEELLRDTNTQLVRGFIDLAQLQRDGKLPDEVMSRQEACRNASLIAIQQLGNTIHRGEIHRQLEWVLLDAHLLMLDDGKGNMTSIEMAERCQKLSVLSRQMTIPAEKELLLLQRQVCEKAVCLLPAGSLALCHLGDVQLAQVDINVENADICLSNAVLSYRASIEVEGKPKLSKEIPSALSEQQWWKDKQAKDQADKAKTTATPSTKGQQSSSGSTSGAAGRGRSQPSRGGVTTPGRAAVTTKPAATATAKVRAPPPTGRAPAVKPSVNQARTAATTKPTVGTTAKTTQPTKPAAGKTTAGVGKKLPTASTASTRNVPTANKQPVKPVSSGAGRPTVGAKGVATLGELKSGVKTLPSTTSTAENNTATEKGQQPVAKSGEDSAGVGLGELNSKSYHPRLGLARALARKGDESSQNESQQLYEAVISMAPHIHDAYIEVAEMLLKKDVLAAVSVYSKFPFSQPPSFDDAYIHGEIVRLLMKQEQYDDPRLGPNLIAFGQVMGINSLEKYVNVLESKFKTNLLKTVYAGVHGKDVDDPDLQAFFKFKCWI